MVSALVLPATGLSTTNARDAWLVDALIIFKSSFPHHSDTRATAALR